MTLGVKFAVLAGADPRGRVLLNSPNPLSLGLLYSHWDPVSFPNLLMEPAINADLSHSVDMTRQEMIDIGWFSDGDGVPDGRDQCIGSSTQTPPWSSTAVATRARQHGVRHRLPDLRPDQRLRGRRLQPRRFVSCVAHLTDST